MTIGASCFPPRSGEVGSGLPDELSRATAAQLFQASRETARLAIDRSGDEVVALLGTTSKTMQERVDDAVSLSLADVCQNCSIDSGAGWRNRSVTRIIDATSDVAENAEKRCIEIADAAFDRLAASVKAFCSTAVDEMAKMGEGIPRVLRSAIEKAHLTTPQEQRAALLAAREAAPAPLSVPPT
jgi:hypothetical protein